MFGTANMAMLFGIVMLAHQVGGFLGAYLGGKVFEATGSYDWVWYIDIVLAVGAALVHLPIREAHLPARTAGTANEQPWRWTRARACCWRRPLPPRCCAWARPMCW
jgi:MFS family permease